MTAQITLSLPDRIYQRVKSLAQTHHQGVAEAIAEYLEAHLPVTESEGVEEAEKVDANRVQGCVSQVWLAGSVENGRCKFRMTADSPLVQGLAALLCELYDGEPADDVAVVEPELFASLRPPTYEGPMDRRAGEFVAGITPPGIASDGGLDVNAKAKPCKKPSTKACPRPS